MTYEYKINQSTKYDIYVVMKLTSQQHNDLKSNININVYFNYKKNKAYTVI